MQVAGSGARSGDRPPSSDPDGVNRQRRTSVSDSSALFSSAVTYASTLSCSSGMYLGWRGDGVGGGGVNA